MKNFDNQNMIWGLLVFDIMTAYAKGDTCHYEGHEFIFNPTEKQDQFSTGKFPVVGVDGWEFLKY